MAKRYLSIEEAAEQLGLTKAEVNQLRTKGEIRGFADRGTFKFKAEDVEELARRLQPSSDPDVPMIDGHDDSSVLEDDAPADDDAPSIIRRLSAGGGEVDDHAAGSIFDDFGKVESGSSDSDVRLVMDDRLTPQHDSGPDVMLQFAESDSDVRLTSDSGRAGKIQLSDSDSDVRLTTDGPLPGDSALKMALSDSDSDVRLDDSGLRGFAPPSGDSDSDVQLAPSAVGTKPKPDSDSDVKLVEQEDDSDSDVHLAEDDVDDGLTIGSQSDSDVRLVTADSDSDVQLLEELPSGPKSGKFKPDSDSDVAVLPDDSGVALERGGSDVGKSGLRGSGSSVVLEDSEISLSDDSGLALGDYSGIALDRAADSGLSLEKGDEEDSGLALFGEDEEEGGITLADDSGIALQADIDGSDIALAGDEEHDEGLTLSDTSADSGIALKDDDDPHLTETMPAMKLPKGKDKRKKADDDDSMGDTMLEVPVVGAEDDQVESDFEIGSPDSGSVANTSVLLFDDEDETDDGGAAMVKKKEVEPEEEEESFEFGGGEEEEEAVAAEDLEGGDVFAGDEAFEEDSEFGESAGDFEAAPAKAAIGTIEYPWGAVTVGSLAVSSICMLLCGMASIDLVRSMWGWQAYSPVNGWLIETLGGLFK